MIMIHNFMAGTLRILSVKILPLDGNPPFSKDFANTSTTQFSDFLNLFEKVNETVKKSLIFNIKLVS